MYINKTRKASYKVGKILGWIKAFQMCAKEKSLMPLIRRIGNTLIGRHVVSKLWLRKGKK